MNSTPVKIDSFCPSCNMHVEATIIARHTYEKDVLFEDLSDPTINQYKVDVFTFAACVRCDRPLLLRRGYHCIEDNAIPQDETYRVYPSDETIPEEVPDTVARPYREARLAYKVKLYDACVVMCRKTLEAVCGRYEEGAGELIKTT